MQIVLVFDGDDTCWMNVWQYYKAGADFFAFLYEEFRDLMPGLQPLFARYFEHDYGLFPLWGIERGRVFFGMLKTYEELLGHFKEKLGESNERFQEILRKKPEHEKRIYEIGDQPFDFYQMKWVDGAREILQEFQNGHQFTTCLLTSYDANVWRDRGKYLEADKYFSRIRIVPSRKTSDDFIEVSGLNTAPPDTVFYAIGNAETDILPALEISDQWRGIYIPHCSSSPMFQAKKGDAGDVYAPPAIDNPRVITIRSFAELRRVDFEKFLLNV